MGPGSTQHPEPLSDTCSRSSVEVEEILPSDEHVQDPRDFYASDSPVLAELDSDQEMYRSAEEFDVSNDTEVQDGNQASNFVARPMRFSCLACAFHY